ncbi:MAG: hypothetical protein REJ23_10070 [Brevundimonas sp.]|nr:hypothetical protein [Brevundimonas sp.]
MILTTLAALLIQQAPVPVMPHRRDVMTTIDEVLDGCGAAEDAARLGSTTERPLGTRNVTAAHKSTLIVSEAPGLCRIIVTEWHPRGARLAQTVEYALVNWTPRFRRGDWRVLMENERGPAVWSSFEQIDADGQIVGHLLVIEPVDGVTGEMSLTYQAARP